MAAVPPIIEATDNRITLKGIFIDIISIPAFFILFVITMLYGGILYLFRVK